MSAPIKEERLTAYLLNEVDETEREVIERALESDPELREELGRLEAFVGRLETSLTAGMDQSDEVELPPELERAADDEAPQEDQPVPKVRWKVVAGTTGISALAAGVALVFILGSYSMDDDSDSHPKAEDVAALMSEIESLKESGASGQEMASRFEKALSHEQKKMLESFGYIKDGDGAFNTERYGQIVENRFFDPSKVPLSTFSIDVDTASYANVRRFLKDGTRPPANAVRIEELINYFDYTYPEPRNGPFSVNVDVGAAPWKPAHRLMRIGLKGKSIDVSDIPPCNLVFLIDTSGSMLSPNKLPLLKRAMRLLVENLGSQDKVAIVTYAGSAGLVLPSTPAGDTSEILAALERLEAGGSTNGGEGIQLAYKVARENLFTRGNNRVILATDGDFNVGATDVGGLIEMAEKNRKTGVSLSVLGFGMGNLKDDTLEGIADKGDGNYAYIDSLTEARKVLVEEMGGTLLTIAKDVKIQVEFNPAEVTAYRLIGYENRLLADQDFNDDTKDAGDIGAGHTVTALYGIVPLGVELEQSGADQLKYQRPRQPSGESLRGELCTVKLRFKPAKGGRSELLELPIRDPGGDPVAELDPDFSHAAAVAAFGMLLRNSQFKGAASWPMVVELARRGLVNDERGYRREFASLVETASRIEP